VSETNLFKVSAGCGRLRRLASSEMPFTQIYRTRRIWNKLSSSYSLSIISKQNIIVLNHISAIHRKTLLCKMGPKLKEEDKKKLENY